MISRCVILILAVVTASPGQERSQVLWPSQVRMEMPAAGFSRLGFDADEDDCGSIPDTLWQRYPGKTFDLWVAADGPSGSGRYWEITFGISYNGSGRPTKGLCLIASTLGWRTLQGFKRSPLPWASDEDGDGKPELIVWESFPLEEEATNADFGLIGWVYAVDSSGACTLDWGMSRKLAAEIAEAYERELAEPNPSMTSRRTRARNILRTFATSTSEPYRAQ